MGQPARQPHNVVPFARGHAHAPPPAFVERDIHRDRRPDLSQQQQPRLSASERRLARWLAARLGFAGAETFLQKFGADVVLGKLHDGVIVWTEPDPLARRRGGVSAGWQVRPGLKSPAGFLRWLVQQGGR